MQKPKRKILARPVVVRPRSNVDLTRIDPDETTGVNDKRTARRQFRRERRRIGDLHGRLYAENKRALLVVLQGMDTAGKDGVIAKVFSWLSPMGCQVSAFSAPSEEERDHDFLWRIWMRLPRMGNIGVFNRSHYEGVLVERVRELTPEAVWSRRFEQINRFENLLDALGTRVVKIFLHIDRKEQRRRLLSRLKDPTKRWKYQPGDLDDRKLWDRYQRAYEDALSRCSTRTAPWYIVPANRKWYRNLAVVQIVRQALEDMDPAVPKLPERKRDEKRLK